MRDTLLLLLLAAAPVLAADSAFNGRWDIEVLNEPRHRVWWLEVSGAGTPDLKGRFVGFPGGDMNDIQKIWIESSEPRFTFDRPQPKGNIHQEYTARVSGKELKGTFAVGKQSLEWIGHGAPEIKEKDDDSWHEGKPVMLFNGKDLGGWHGLVPDKDLGWSVKDGLLSS